MSSNRSQSSNLSNTPRRVRRSAALLVLLLVLALFVVGGMLYTVQLLAPVTGNRDAPPVLVNIPPGRNAHQIGEILARKHLVRSPLSFVFASRMDGLSGRMHAGRYELSPAMPPRQIAAKMALGETAQGVVTIPEGYTVRQIAQRLAEHHLADEAQFLALARTQGRTFHVGAWTPPDASLEGYLFPDTYTVPKGAAPRDIIQTMLGNFAGRVVTPHAGETARFPGGLPAAVTLASLVEREAEVDADRPLIAAVYRNRLKAGMRLQCDATVQYALAGTQAPLVLCGFAGRLALQHLPPCRAAADAHREPRPAEHRGGIASRPCGLPLLCRRGGRPPHLQHDAGPA